MSIWGWYWLICAIVGGVGGYIWGRLERRRGR